jgi:hypothetical protein
MYLLGIQQQFPVLSPRTNYTDRATAAWYLIWYFQKYFLLDSSIYKERGRDFKDRGSIPGIGKTFFSSSQGPDRLWDPHILLSNGY